MKSNALEFSVSRFLRGLLPLAVVALALSIVSISQFALPTRAQDGQKSATAPASNGSDSARVVYPETRRDDTVDDYFGTKVLDPYRWLENDHSAETGKWVEAQNKVTFAYLEKFLIARSSKAA